MLKVDSDIAIGSLFVFEGPDGVGKTTLVERVGKLLERDGVQYISLSFPGKTEGTLGGLVYKLHHNPGQFNMSEINNSSFQTLHIAAHIECIENVILPALKKGLVVILDRFWWSTVAYGRAGGVPKEILKALIEIERAAWCGIMPNMAFLISRNKPFRAELTTKTWESVCKEYEKLSIEQKKSHPVEIVRNDKDVSSIANNIYWNMFNDDKQQSFSYVDDKCSSKESFVYIPNRKWLPTKTTIVFDTYWKFAYERQEIFFKRLKVKFGPFTNDPILRVHKFTNAYRAADRVSQYLIKNVIYCGDQAPQEIFFRTLLFKMFNKIETWEKLLKYFGEISYKDYSFTSYSNVLTKEKEVGTIYSAAYIMPSGGKNMPYSAKHNNHLNLLEKMMEESLPDKICDAKSLQQVFELLRSYPMIGDFLAFQYAIDLNYSSMIDFSEMSFVVPGPGAKDGMRKCFSDFGGLSEVDIIKCMADRQEQEFERLELPFKNLWGRRLQLIDCQNLFCEVDKYARIAHPDVCGLTGRKKIKQKFKPIHDSIEYYFPPKWGINKAVNETIGGS